MTTTTTAGPRGLDLTITETDRITQVHVIPTQDSTRESVRLVLEAIDNAWTPGNPGNYGHDTARVTGQAANFLTYVVRHASPFGAFLTFAGDDRVFCVTPLKPGRVNVS